MVERDDYLLSMFNKIGLCVSCLKIFFQAKGFAFGGVKMLISLLYLEWINTQCVIQTGFQHITCLLLFQKIQYQYQMRHSKVDVLIPHLIMVGIPWYPLNTGCVTVSLSTIVSNCPMQRTQGFWHGTLQYHNQGSTSTLTKCILIYLFFKSILSQFFLAIFFMEFYTSLPIIFVLSLVKLFRL
jgi:hypothetical protein